jgi:hypothetical protein
MRRDCAELGSASKCHPQADALPPTNCERLQRFSCRVGCQVGSESARTRARLARHHSLDSLLRGCATQPCHRPTPFCQASRCLCKGGCCCGEGGWPVGCSHGGQVRVDGEQARPNARGPVLRQHGQGEALMTPPPPHEQPTWCQTILTVQLLLSTKCTPPTLPPSPTFRPAAHGAQLLCLWLTPICVDFLHLWLQCARARPSRACMCQTVHVHDNVMLLLSKSFHCHFHFSVALPLPHRPPLIAPPTNPRSSASAWPGKHTRCVESYFLCASGSRVARTHCHAAKHTMITRHTASLTSGSQTQCSC